MNKGTLCKIRDIYRSLEHFDKEFSERFGLDLTQALALCLLREEPDRGPGEMAAALGMKASHTSKLIAKLEDSKLIRRRLCKEDRRCMKFTLTPEGERLLAVIEDADLPLPAFFQAGDL